MHDSAGALTRRSSPESRDPVMRIVGAVGVTALDGVEEAPQPAPLSARTVSADGTFTWQRKTGKKIYVYFEHAEARSNTVTISAR